MEYEHAVEPGSSCGHRTQWQMLKTLASDVIYPLHIDRVFRPSAYHGRGFQRTMQGDVFSRAPLRAEYRHIIWYLEETPGQFMCPGFRTGLFMTSQGSHAFKESITATGDKKLLPAETVIR